ncbi:MAG: ferritin-like domain-containing protein [Gammaproteobacteria bacterium]
MSKRILLLCPETPIAVLNRRSFLRTTGQATLSATAIALLSGNPSLAAHKQKQAAAANPDVSILNAALAAEYHAVAAYQVGAESGLLKPEVLKLAVQFQGHHKTHGDLLAATVRTLGGTPAEPKARYEFPVDTLKNQADVLKFAAGLEQGAVSAYLDAVPKLGDRQLAKAAASILGDEAMHWAVLLQALGLDPAPVAFVS